MTHQSCESRRLRRAALCGSTAVILLAAIPALADQPVPATVRLAQAADTAPTDIGRVSTTGGTEDVTVTPSGTGTRAQAKAAEHQAINKIIVQPQSEIQKLPDVTIAQALSRLPGISLETDSGEGRFINIRGLDADLNATTFDGVRILPSNLASPTGNSRAVAYDALPAGLVGGIEISETLRPEDDPEALGGLVNLLPRKPPGNGEPFLNATAGLGEELLRGTQIQDYGITVGASFGIQPGHGPFDHPVAGSGFLSNPKPFTFLFTDSQHNDFRGVDDWEPGYSDQQSAGAPDRLLSNVTLRHYLYNRRRFDRGGEFDFDPNDSDHFFVRYGFAGYNEHAEKDYLAFNGLDSGFVQGVSTGIDPSDPSGKSFFAPSATVSRTSTDTEEEVRNQIFEGGGRDVLFDRIKIDYHGAYSEGTDKFPTAYGSQFAIPNPVALSYNNQSNPSYLRYHTTDGTNLLDQNAYQFDSVSNAPSSSRDREYSGAFNVTVPFQLLTPTDEIKAGAILRLRDRIQQNSNGVSFSNLDGNGNPIANLPLSRFTSGPSLVFYDGAYNIGPSINAAAVNAFLGGQAAGYDPTQFQHDTENVYAGYVQYSGSAGKLSWLGGVRVEDTFGVYRGFSTVTDAAGNVTNPPATFKHAYTSYFPSLQLKYDITPKMVVRAIYDTALGRPGFDQITPGITASLANNTLTIGNPNLSPYYADAFDLFWEYYPNPDAKISAGGFDKELSTYIYQSQLFGSNTTFPFTDPARVSINTYSNSGPGRIYGIEAEYTQQLRFLTPPFDGFGFDGNLTYVQSEATIRRDRGDGVIANETLQLPQTSPWNFNASIFYEKAPITFRFAANYVSKDLYTLGSTKAGDTYVQQRFRLDLGTAYAINKHLEVYFDAHNLTDQVLKYTETASNSRSIQREFYGADVIGGVRVTY